MSFSIATKITNRFDRVRKAKERASRQNLFRSAAGVRKDAVASIERAEGPSEPGTPPHTHRRSFFRRAIRFWVGREEAIVGPRASVVGNVAQAHEFGGEFRGQTFPERPTMGPALEGRLSRLAPEWRGTIGE